MKLNAVVVAPDGVIDLTAYQAGWLVAGQEIVYSESLGFYVPGKGHTLESIQRELKNCAKQNVGMLQTDQDLQATY